MPSKLKPMVKFAFALAASAGFMASSALAQSETEIAEACLKAVEVGDTETAKELASQMMSWRYQFNFATIKNAEQCLKSVTGEQWKYFATKGRYLSGEEARAEQAFIDEADDRMAAQKKNLKRRRCEVTIARFELSNLEEEYKSIKEARKLEAIRETLNACTQMYETDKSAALLNPVCNGVFVSIGIPDTEYAFEDAKLENARLKLAVSQIKLWIASSNNATARKTTDAAVNECQELLAE